MTDSGMIIDRSKHAQRFVTIGNDEARDHRLSFRARGLHHHLLSLPHGWHVTTVQLAKENPEGREAIRTALNELVKFGYVTRTKRQDARGRWFTTMTVHDGPQDITPCDGPVTSTEDGFPGVGNPGVGFPGAKELKTETKDGKSLAPRRASTSGQGDEKMAPRRAASSGFGDISGSQTIITEVRRAAVTAYGDNAKWLTDEQCAAMHSRFCCQPDGTPREIKISVHAYLAGRNGVLRKVPTLEQALQPRAERGSSIPFDAQIRWDDPDISDDERHELVQDVLGRAYGPGEECAASAMMLREPPRSLGYIINSIEAGNLFIAA